MRNKDATQSEFEKKKKKHGKKEESEVIFTVLVQDQFSDFRLMKLIMKFFFFHSLPCHAAKSQRFTPSFNIKRIEK